MGWIPECSPGDINSYAGRHVTDDWRLFWLSRLKGGYSENAAERSCLPTFLENINPIFKGQGYVF